MRSPIGAPARATSALASTSTKSPGGRQAPALARPPPYVQRPLPAHPVPTARAGRFELTSQTGQRGGSHSRIEPLRVDGRSFQTGSNVAFLSCAEKGRHRRGPSCSGRQVMQAPCESRPPDGARRTTWRENLAEIELERSCSVTISDASGLPASTRSTEQGPRARRSTHRGEADRQRVVGAGRRWVEAAR